MPAKTQPRRSASPRFAGARAERPASAVFLTELLSELNDGAGFLDRLSLAEITVVRRATSSRVFHAGETVFLQGDPHTGIFLIESGRVRTYYASPSGREITLAYWTPGHFVGGPEVFGGGLHVWSASAMEASRLSYLPGTAIRHLVQTVPSFALCIIEGLVAKGKCYSALVQMLGTRSVTERLAQLLLILARAGDPASGKTITLDQRVTHEQLASIVGSTRQWVTSTLNRFQGLGLIRVERGTIIVDDPDGLRTET